MKESLDVKKALSQSLISWYLTVGSTYCNLSKNKAIHIAGVNQLTFKSWLLGKRSAPAIIIERIKLGAFGYAISPRCLSNREKCYQANLLSNAKAALIKQHFDFKIEVLRNSNVLAKRKIFKKLKRLNKFKF